MKIKMDRYDINALVNGLYTMKDMYDGKDQTLLCDLILSLIEIYDSMNPKRRVKVEIDGYELRIISRCLIEWRNTLLADSKLGAADAVADLLIKMSI